MSARLFEAAKQALGSLTNVLEKYCGDPTECQDGIRFNACPNPACGKSKGSSLKVSANPETGRWRCHKCGANGTVVDLMAYIWGSTPTEAAMQATEAARRGAPLPPAAAVSHPPQDLAGSGESRKAVRHKAQAECFALLRDAVKTQADDLICLGYLVNKRQIPLPIVREAQNRGMLGFLPGKPEVALQFLRQVLGEKRMKEVGLWRPDAAKPAQAFRPIVSFLPGADSAEFRLVRDPHSKDERKALRYGHADAPWFWKGTEPEKALVVEGIIDLLSSVALGWKGDIVGLAGCNNWQLSWFKRVQDVRKTQKLGVMFDNDADPDTDSDADSEDNPGQKAAVKLIATLEAAGMNAENRVLPPGMDVNLFLRQKAAA